MVSTVYIVKTAATNAPNRATLEEKRTAPAPDPLVVVDLGVVEVLLGVTVGWDVLVIMAV